MTENLSCRIGSALTSALEMYVSFSQKASDNIFSMYFPVFQPNIANPYLVTDFNFLVPLQFIEQILRPYMPDQHRLFFANQPYLAVGASRFNCAPFCVDSSEIHLLISPIQVLLTNRAMYGHRLSTAQPGSPSALSPPFSNSHRLSFRVCPTQFFAFLFRSR